MIEKALIIMMFLYATSFGVLGAQYVFGDVFGVALTNFEGVPIKSHLLGIVDVNNLNSALDNIVSANFTENSTAFDRVENSIIAVAFVAWELILLMTGTYIFNFLFLMGIPAIIIAGMVVLYIILVARAIIAYVRGV